jgi:hypothetical protein
MSGKAFEMFIASAWAEFLGVSVKSGAFGNHNGGREKRLLVNHGARA